MERRPESRGKESDKTTLLLSKVMAEGLAQTALLGTYIQAIQTRAEVFALIAFNRYINLVILRGSDSLVIVTVEQRVVMHATPSSSYVMSMVV